MASNNSNLPVGSLDFDDIKSNLKEFLKAQTQFKDYDFEGSGLNVLIDLLAYNTHYGAFQANMVANETFLDSAVLRPSIVSIAKHLNYVPKSFKSATAYVDVEFLNVASSPTLKTTIESGAYFISKGDRFSANTGSKIFLFYATSDTKVVKEGSQYFARNIEIKEGTSKTITYVWDTVTNNTDQKFVIPSLSVDTDTLSVRVARSISDTTGIENLWTAVSDINKLNSDSDVFFLQQNSDLYYEIYFGDGVLGKQPDAGNVINIFYAESSGSSANGLGKNETTSNPTFKYMEFNSSKTLLLTDSVTGKPSPTYGGSEMETLQSIKYYAPRNYQAQERAVTAEDYRVLLARQYGDQAESVFIWGGEDNDPPIYGKVFVSIKPKNAEKLTQIQKLAIAKNILKERNVVSITPEIVDPDYLYLIPNITVRYDKNKTTLTTETLQTNVKILLYNYAQQNVGKFDRDFIESVFLSYINDNYNPPIIGSNLTLQLEKRLEPNLESITTYAINFDNAIYHPIDGYTSVLSSSAFTYQDSTSEETIPPNVEAYINDDGYGNVRIYKLVSGSKIYINETAGTIDYTTGKITLVNFAPQSISDSKTYISFTATPESKDISSRRNQILIVELEGISVTAIPQILNYDPYNP